MIYGGYVTEDVTAVTSTISRDDRLLNLVQDVSTAKVR